MGVVSISEHRERDQVAVWDAYCAASRKAQATACMEDGLEAGRQWRRWLELFMTPDQRAALDCAVLPMERRR